jgi:hypothetical protein
MPAGEPAFWIDDAETSVRSPDEPEEAYSWVMEVSHDYTAWIASEGLGKRGLRDIRREITRKTFVTDAKPVTQISKMRI